jgi:hypothetical protein
MVKVIGWLQVVAVVLVRWRCNVLGQMLEHGGATVWRPTISGVITPFLFAGGGGGGGTFTARNWWNWRHGWWWKWWPLWINPQMWQCRSCKYVVVVVVAGGGSGLE